MLQVTNVPFTKSVRFPLASLNELDPAKSTNVA